jgi:hypothetical protein
MPGIAAMRAATARMSFAIVGAFKNGGSMADIAERTTLRILGLDHLVLRARDADFDQARGALAVGGDLLG